MSLASRSSVRLLSAFAIALFFGLTAPVRAEAPMVKTQAPGYYRMMMGQFEVTALFDGMLHMDSARLTQAKPQDIQKWLTRSFSRTDKIQLAVNAYLINTGEHLVLVDAGGGTLYGPALGQLRSALKAAGYEPGQVDTVVVTHMHGDHIGGLIDASGAPVFPNAQIYVEEAEAGYWLSDAVAASAPADRQRIFAAARKVAAPYLNRGQWKPFTIGAEIVPGIKTMPGLGHTPGHTIVAVESQSARLLIVGDLIHSHAVQFPQPGVGFDFDVNVKQAIATRRALLRYFAKHQALIAGSHLPFPGIGHLRAENGTQYSWVPIEYTPMVAP